MKLYHIFLLINAIFCAKNDPKMVFPNPRKLSTAFSEQAINRPQFHFTPDYGWMNDPNGLWYDKIKKTYHLYYQFNPADTVWALPLYWGHATSKDLIKWEHSSNPLPIGPVEVKDDNYVTSSEDDKISSTVDPKSGAYSGSIFIDDGDQSEWFKNKEDSEHNNIIAAWTYNYPNYEAQWLSYSLDNGESFYNPYDGDKAVNPIIDLNKEYEHFRDPQVIKLLFNFTSEGEGENEKRTYTYIMTVAKPQEYKIAFYSSINLKKWEENKDLELEGFLGYQYECPNLVHLYNDNQTADNFASYESSYWILFISINPGSINGGSSTWYLIGQFVKNSDNKFEFIPTYHYPAPLDYGKDFYAMQLIYNSGELHENNPKLGYNYIFGIAWASNWQYTGVVPTDPWRSSMSLPRKVSLGKFNSSPERDILFLKSVPIEGDHFSTPTEHIKEDTFVKAGEEKKSYSLTEITGSFKFEMTFIVNSEVFDNKNPGHFNIELIGKDTSEYLLLGYESGASAFYVDRSHSNVEWVHKNPYFSDKISVNLIPKKTEGKVHTFEVKGYVDRNIIELFFNEGYQTMTNTFFFSGGNFIEKISLSSDYSDNGFKVSSFNTYIYKEESTTNPQTSGD